MRILYVLIFFVSVNTCLSQINRCSTDEYRAQLGVFKTIETNHTIDLDKVNINEHTIPVVVHILYNDASQNISDERVYSQIESLNNDYNALNSEIYNIPDQFIDEIGQVGFNFCLVQQDPNGNSFSGINRVYTDVESFQGFSDSMKKSNEGGVDAWDTETHLNIWVCNLSGNTLGFATMPGDVSDELDGVVIDYLYFGIDISFTSPYNLGRTATHEIGHYFNLEHTFYAGCSDWDECDDTPPTSSPTYGCPSYPQTSCMTNTMTMNFMDYTDDQCMAMFTQCQAQRMRNCLLNNRSGLINNYTCTTSVEESYLSSISFYPNPASNFLYIKESHVFVEIFDVTGRKITELKANQRGQVNISKLNCGTYFLKLQNKTKQFIKI